jgi:anthranilate synthase component II
MFLLIDNYDSFTYNLYHYLLELGANVEVYRNDQITTSEIAAKKYQGIIISPGPATPDDAGICLKVIAGFSGKIPILGVCLGHQAIAQHFGAKIIRGAKPMHAKISEITHNLSSKLFAEIPEKFQATRYHSLIIDLDTMPKDLLTIATSADGVIQAIEHRSHKIYGVQFHPESIASEFGHQILKNFINIAGVEDA